MKSATPPPFNLPARYQYAGETYSGGQGSVYLCVDVLLDRKVAIKTIQSLSSHPALLKEVAARAKISSKHVVEMYELLFDSKGKPFALVLEYVPGVPLEDRNSIPSTLGGRLRLLYQLACALHEIHSAGVIHRDIKPENIKVDSSGILRVFDLGISNLDADLASTNAAAGTAIYRSPELYGTLPINVSTAVDIYALGVTAWFILSPTCPNELMQLPPQKSGAPPSIAITGPGLGDLAATIDRALSPNPDLRPTALELKDSIAAVLMYGLQRGVFAHGIKIWELSKVGGVSALSVGKLGSIKIAYSGDAFLVSEFAGDVYVNNSPVSLGDRLPESCVLTFGAPALGSGRAFVPFDSSRPEIVL
jgi:serine/threonine protein kinase